MGFLHERGKNCSTKPSRKEKTLKNMLYTFIANVLFLQQLWCMKGKVMVTQGHSQIPYYISLLYKIDSFKHSFIDKDLEPKNQGSTWQQSFSSILVEFLNTLPYTQLQSRIIQPGIPLTIKFIKECLIWIFIVCSALLQQIFEFSRQKWQHHKCDSTNRFAHPLALICDMNQKMY